MEVISAALTEMVILPQRRGNILCHPVDIGDSIRPHHYLIYRGGVLQAYLRRFERDVDDIVLGEPTPLHSQHAHHAEYVIANTDLLAHRINPRATKKALHDGIAKYGNRCPIGIIHRAEPCSLSQLQILDRLVARVHSLYLRAPVPRSEYCLVACLNERTDAGHVWHAFQGLHILWCQRAQ